MLKKILLITLGVLLGGYIVFSVTYMNPKINGNIECQNMKVEIARNSEISYLDENQIHSYLKQHKIDPVGQKMSEIDTDSITNILNNNRLIKNAKVYKTIEGTLKVEIFQKTPILRIISEKGNYYIDNEGEIMPIPAGFAAYVPLATGNISEEYAKNQLFDFAQFLQKNKFWDSQIEQIHVNSKLDIELVPRVGNHYIILGKIEDYKENLTKLKLFYDKGLNKIGWNKYSVINLKFKDQVVCTKR